MTIFYLILTFYTASGYGVSITTTTLPAVFGSAESCDAAGTAARKNFNGGAKVEWTCVPAGAQ